MDKEHAESIELATPKLEVIRDVYQTMNYVLNTTDK